MQKIKLLIWTLAFIASIWWVYFAYSSLKKEVKPEIIVAEQVEFTENEDESTSEDGRTKAPDFSVEDAYGNLTKLSDMEGKPVVLNFWASWCPPCKAEMPEFDKIYLESDDDIIFMMVDLTDGQRETVEIAAEYVANQGFSFPVYYDTEQDAANAYGIRSIPTTLFIDKNGYIVAGAEGQIDEDTLRYGISLIQE